MGVSREDYVRDNAPLIKVLTRVGHESGAVLLDPTDQLCSKEYCEAFVGNDPIYKDIGHIRPYYARDYIRTFDTIVLAPVSVEERKNEIR
jgi:hypothetical protein